MRKGSIRFAGNQASLSLILFGRAYYDASLELRARRGNFRRQCDLSLLTGIAQIDGNNDKDVVIDDVAQRDPSLCIAHPLLKFLCNLENEWRCRIG